MKNTWLHLYIYIYNKFKNVLFILLFEQLHLLEPSMGQYLFLINYKEFQAPQNCSSDLQSHYFSILLSFGFYTDAYPSSPFPIYVAKI